jgi:hypothetical protein
MSVTEKLMAPGGFSLVLNKQNTPNSVINTIDAWGHIVIIPADLNVQEFDDATLLDSARYVGIVESLELGLEDDVNIAGVGLVSYLGDSETRGMPIATTGGPSGVRSYKNKTLEQVLDSTGSPKGILRTESGGQGPIRKGTITEPTDSSTYTGKHYTESALKAIRYICQDLNVEFKIDTKGYLSAGPSGTLFAGIDSDPTAIIVRGGGGQDPNISGINTTSLVAQFDASEFVSSVELIASKHGAEANIGNATVSSNPYKDLFGSDLLRTQYVSDPQTEGTTKTERAGAYLSELNLVKKSLNVSLEEYDISGDFKVGDKIFIFDPDIGFQDTEVDRISDGRDSLYETVYQGQVLNPTKIRILSITWPVLNGYGVFYRDKNGSYTELTDYVVWESGDVQLEIGDVAPSISESLNLSGHTVDLVGSPDKSVPDTPSGLTTVAGSYSDGNGISKAFIKMSWTEPTNTDGSSITDGSYYRVRWRVVQDTDGNNIIDSNDDQATEYNYSTLAFDKREFVIYDLSPNTYYSVGVQAVDTSGFDSEFTSIASLQTTRDGGAPNKPDGFATIASNPLRVQFIHNLGQAKDNDGNAVSPIVNFTLAKDIDHLNIYASTTQGFDLEYNSVTKRVSQTGYKIGELKAGSAHILNTIAAIGYIDLDNADTHYFRVTAVDTSGNESEPSDEQEGNADLVDTQNIANLAVTNAILANAAVTDLKVVDVSAGKLTAGTISGQTIILDASGDTGADSIIKSSNYVSGSTGWAINSDGTAEFRNATIRGSLNASDITAGTLSSDRLDTDFIAVGGAASDVNSGSTTIDGGSITANSITASQIASSTITTNQLNFTPYTDGENIDSGSIGGISIDSDSIHTSGYPSSGFEITSSGNANFLNVLARGTISGTVDTTLNAGSSGYIQSGSGANRVRFGAGSGAAIDFIYNSGTVGIVEAVGSDTFRIRGYTTGDNIEMYAGGLGGAGTLSLNQGTLNISGGTNIVTTVGTKLTLSGSSGNSGQVLKSNANGMSWGNVDTTSTFTNSNNAVTINNTNSTINISVGNDSNTLSAGHNHPYLTSVSENNHNHSNYLTSLPNHTHNFSADITGFSGNNHDHSAYLSVNHVLNTTNPHSISGNNHNHSNYATENYVNGQILQHRIDYYHSDERLKENISETNLGLDFINRLQPRDFTWKSDYLDYIWSDDENLQAQKLKGFQSNLQQGFIAQEVQDAVYQETGSNNAFGGLTLGDVSDFEKTTTSDADDFGRVDYTQFIAPLVKAVQQLSAKIEVLEARVDELEGV